MASGVPRELQMVGLQQRRRCGMDLRGQSERPWPLGATGTPPVTKGARMLVRGESASAGFGRTRVVPQEYLALVPRNWGKSFFVCGKEDQWHEAMAKQNGNEAISHGKREAPSCQPVEMAGPRAVENGMKDTDRTKDFLPDRKQEMSLVPPKINKRRDYHEQRTLSDLPIGRRDAAPVV